MNAKSSSIRLCAFADEASADRHGQIAALSQNRISLLEMRGVDGINVAGLSAAVAKTFKKELDDAGIGVWSIGSPVGKSPITQDFSVEKEQFERLLDTAHITGASCMRIFSFYGTDGSQACFDEVCYRLDVFCDMAKGSGVNLCHENEKGIFGDTAPRCLALHKALPRLKAVFDPANFIQCGQDVMQAWDSLAPHVWYGHIKDAAGDGSIVPPGEGVGRLREYLPLFAALAKEGKNSGVLTLEPHLAEFVGLAGLENRGERSVVGGCRFESERAAFDHAAKCLSDILKTF